MRLAFSSFQWIRNPLLNGARFTFPPNGSVSGLFICFFFLVRNSCLSNCKPLKALSHCAMFRATFLATPFRDKLHEKHCSVTYLATAENVARQVAETIAESIPRFYFLQRFQATFGFVAQSPEPTANCERLYNVPCNLSRNALRDKFHGKIAPYDRALRR